jgi:hypothetical protein
MRTACPALILLLAVSNAHAAPAPDLGRKAREKLQALEKRLPDAIDAWAKAYLGRATVTGDGHTRSCSARLRRVRALADDEAKVVVAVYHEWDGKRDPHPNHLLAVYLKSYDGQWTAQRYSWGGYPIGGFLSSEVADFLMDAIDEAAEK